MTERTDKVSRVLMKHIADILRQEISDPRIDHVTITKVEVQKDLRGAKIFYTVFDETVDKKEIQKGLKSAESFVRTELAKRISMKFTPKLSFWKDFKKEKDHLIDDIFEKIKKERSNDGQ